MQLRKDSEKSILALLKEAGLSSYEARAYVALVKRNPVTRYELAKISGVPSPKIYSAVQKLYERGYVYQTADEVPYITPIDPTELIDDLRANKEETIKQLEEKFDEIQDTFMAKDLDFIWIIAGFESALTKAKETIEKATSTVYIAGFSHDLDLLRDPICRTSGRGVRTRILSYGSSEFEGCDVAVHFDSEGITERTGGHWLTIVGDNAEVLVSYPMDDGCNSVWTNSPVLSLIITKYIDEHFYEQRLSDRELSGQGQKIIIKGSP